MGHTVSGGIFMIEPDTVKLLRECDAGVQMGISSIGEVEDYVKSEGLKNILATAKRSMKNLTARYSGCCTDMTMKERNLTP